MSEPFEVKQGTSAVYAGTLRDASGVVVTLASMVSLTLTLYDKSSGVQINSRNAVNALNANNVTYHATSGLLTWEIQAADNAIVDTNLVERRDELHIALFDFTYDTDKVGKHEVPIKVIKNQTSTAP